MEFLNQVHPVVHLFTDVIVALRFGREKETKLSSMVQNRNELKVNTANHETEGQKMFK